jgi:hypothetical protein
VADSLLIALVGGLLGVVVAPLATHLLITFLPRGVPGTALQSVVNTRLLFFVSCEPVRRFSDWLCPGAASWPEIVDLLAHGTIRHYIRRPPASKGYCNGSDCIYPDPCHRGRLVCANP